MPDFPSLPSLPPGLANLLSRGDGVQGPLGFFDGPLDTDAPTSRPPNPSDLPFQPPGREPGNAPGPNPPPFANGPNAPPSANGPNPPPFANGPNASPSANGPNPPPFANGPNAPPSANGPNPPPFANGSPSAPPFQGGSPVLPNSPAPPMTTGGQAQATPVTMPLPDVFQPPAGRAAQTAQAVFVQFTGTGFTASNAAQGAAANAAATANPVLPAMMPAQTAPTALAQAGVPAFVAGGQTAVAGAVTPNAAPPPQGNPGSNAANAAPLARGAELPPPQARPEAALAQRAEPGLLERLAALLRPGGTTQAAQAAQTTQSSALAMPGATQAAAVLALPLLAVPPSQSPADARGLTLLAVNDRAGVARPDVMPAGTYTADGYSRRALRRGLLANALPAPFSRLLFALRLGGPPVAMRGRSAEYELSTALQWLFWLLALVAYACLGLAMVAFLPSGSDVLGGGGRAWTGGFAVAGLIAGAGAWWFARQLSVRRRSEDDSAT